MKILKKNDGALTNCEVLDFLKSKGATSDPLGCIGMASASECKVYDYLIQSAACNQTKANIDEFLKRSERFQLAKAEILNIVNERPTNQAALYPIIERIDKRYPDAGEETSKVEELVQLVLDVLPPPAYEENEPDSQEEEIEKEETVSQGGEQMDE